MNEPPAAAVFDVDGIGIESSSSFSLAMRRILPFFSGSTAELCEERPAATPTVVSSRKLHAANWRGDEGKARETRRCCFREGLAEAADDEGGNGAVNENVDDDGGIDPDIVVMARSR